MADQEKLIRLGNSDLAYLRDHSILTSRLDEIVAMSVPQASFVVIDRELAETIRAKLTERLAQVGFNEKYEPTTEGRYLEDLIDRLFLK